MKRRLLSPHFSSSARLSAFWTRCPKTYRSRAEEIAAGVSDVEVLLLAKSRSADLRLLDELHAKLYLVDNARALIGSANVTSAGLGIARRPNLELLQLVPVEAAQAVSFLMELRRRSRIATQEEANRLKKWAAIIGPRLLYESEAQPVSEPLEDWIPRFRSPDRLYQMFKAVESGSVDEVGEAALADLEWLIISRTLPEEMFNECVRGVLRRSPTVQDLDQFLKVPRRFGELIAWLKSRSPQKSHDEREGALQTLIRWLMYFDGGRYRIDELNYSEVLSLRPE